MGHKFQISGISNDYFYVEIKYTCCGHDEHLKQLPDTLMILTPSYFV